MSAANAGSHHSSSSAGSASRRTSAWFSSDYNSGYSGLTDLRAGSRQSTVPSGYTGLTDMRSASVRGYGSGAQEGHQGLFGQAYRSPAVSSIHSVPHRAAPVPAPSTHVSSGHAAPRSASQVSQRRPAPILSPPTHARKYVFGLGDYLEEQRQTAGHPVEHPADAMEVEGDYFYEPLSELETPGSHSQSPGIDIGGGWPQAAGGHAQHPSPLSRHSPRIIRPEDPYAPGQGPPSGETLYQQDWPRNLPAPPRAHDVPMRIHYEDVPSPGRVPTRSECEEQVRHLHMRMERAKRRADSGIRYMRQRLTLLEQDYDRWRANIRPFLEEVREDMARIKRRHPEFQTPTKRRRDEGEGSGSSGGSRRRLS